MWSAALWSQETPTKSCKSGESNLHIQFKNPSHQRSDIQEAIQCLKESLLTEGVVPFWGTTVALAVMPRLAGWDQGHWPERSAEFRVYMLTMQSNA